MLKKEMDGLEYQNLKINPLEQTVYYFGEEIPLTNREFQLLYLLLKYQGQVFSKRQIYEQITEDGEQVDYHTVEITISRIRKNWRLILGERILLLPFVGGDINLENRGMTVGILSDCGVG